MPYPSRTPLGLRVISSPVRQGGDRKEVMGESLAPSCWSAARQATPVLCGMGRFMSRACIGV